MAGSIKGIIVEIGGDTSGLQKALSKVNSATSSLSRELRGVNSLLKLDPKNTELLKQKQDILNESISNTQNKLKQLQELKEKADDKMANGTKINSENYRALQREIINTENKLKNLQVESSKLTQIGRKFEEIGTKIQNVGNKIDSLGNKLTTRITTPILALGTVAITTGNEFEAQMSRVQAIAGATKDELEILTKQAIELGSKTSFSATEVATAMENLASAGFTTTEIMESIPGLLNLAASSGAELGTASEIAASAIRGFGLEAESSAHVADVFAEAAARTNAQTEDMGEAMKYVAPVAKTVGLSIEETAAAIGIMSDSGIKGSQAGTTLRSGLTRIIKPTKQVHEAMETLGVEFYDNNGKMKSLTEIIEELQKGTKGLTDETKNQALAQIFGTEALSGMLALVNEGPGELKKLTKSFEKCDGAAEKMAETMLDNTSGAIESLKGSLESAGITIQKALSPTIKKLAKKIQDLVDSFNDLSEEEQQNIIKIGLMVAAAGPLIKVLGKVGNTIGTVSKGIGIFSQAVSLTGKTTTTAFKEASFATQNLAKVFTNLTSPAGIAAIGIAGAVAIIVAAVREAERETKESFANMGKGASDFVTGIEKAESHLDSFNSTLFASSEEQQKLQEDMDKIQEGITKICKKASDERRNYTQKEIKQLDEYFKKLRELKNRELEIQENIANAISQQAVTNAEAFKGSLDEYKIQSQEWIKTATEQKDATIAIIKDGTTQEVALLNQRYSTEESRRTEKYQKEYNDIMEQQQKKIDLANQEVAEVTKAYANGYLERSKENDNWYAKLQEHNQKVEEENKRHTERKDEIENGFYLRESDRTYDYQREHEKHNYKMQEIWKELYENMNESQEKQLGVWLAQVAQTELYGGELDEETQKIVDTILESYDSMPKGTKEAMKNAMEPMLEEMEDTEPSLFAKASSIANGILTRLKNAFDIHSPSRETRSIFKNVMQGAELGLEDEENKLYKQADAISHNLLSKFRGITTKGISMGELNSKIVDSTKTIFTTPQIVFNVQELDEARLNQCFNYVNRKFGSQY